MKVLVMGGTQFNGLALVNELVNEGHDVTVVNRGKSDKVELPRSVKRLYCDRTDTKQMKEVLGGLEFDCIQDMSAYQIEDVQLMEEIFRGSTGHYIFASSTAIYDSTKLLPITEDHPVNDSAQQGDYGLGKIRAEEFLVRKYRETGFPATIGVLSMMFGPNNILPDRVQRMFKRILSGRPVLIPGDGTTLGQIGHVEDGARAFRMMMQQPVTFGKRYNLLSDGYYSDEGYVDTFAKVTGVSPQKIFIPHQLMDDFWTGEAKIDMQRVTANIDTRSKASSDHVQMLYGLTKLIQRLGPNLHHWSHSVIFSTDRLKRDIGWSPRYTFSGAVEHTYQWYRDKGINDSLEFDFDFEDRLIEMVSNWKS